MKIYFATDHAGYEYKEILLPYVRDDLGYEVEDCGAHTFDPYDDYPDFVYNAAWKVGEDPQHSKAIILGGSGQGEAIVANRITGVRAVVYYGAPTKEQVDTAGEHIDMIDSTRLHNDANILSLGARFVSIEEAKEVVKRWLQTTFEKDERHVRRIKKIDA